MGQYVTHRSIQLMSILFPFPFFSTTVSGLSALQMPRESLRSPCWLEWEILISAWHVLYFGSLSCLLLSPSVPDCFLGEFFTFRVYVLLFHLLDSLLSSCFLSDFLRMIFQFTNTSLCFVCCVVHTLWIPGALGWLCMGSAWFWRHQCPFLSLTIEKSFGSQTQVKFKMSEMSTCVGTVEKSSSDCLEDRPEIFGEQRAYWCTWWGTGLNY